MALPVFVADAIGFLVAHATSAHVMSRGVGGDAVSLQCADSFIYGATLPIGVLSHCDIVGVVVVVHVCYWNAETVFDGIA
ncbi:hypothetical protein D3C80_1702010 [compost metagenome]